MHFSKIAESNSFIAGFSIHRSEMYFIAPDFFAPSDKNEIAVI
jgi:hypothetical protein